MPPPSIAHRSIERGPSRDEQLVVDHDGDCIAARTPTWLCLQLWFDGLRAKNRTARLERERGGAGRGVREEANESERKKEREGASVNEALSVSLFSFISNFFRFHFTNVPPPSAVDRRAFPEIIVKVIFRGIAMASTAPRENEKRPRRVEQAQSSTRRPRSFGNNECPAHTLHKQTKIQDKSKRVILSSSCNNIYILKLN